MVLGTDISKLSCFTNDFWILCIPYFRRSSISRWNHLRLNAQPNTKLSIIIFFWLFCIITTTKPHWYKPDNENACYRKAWSWNATQMTNNPSEFILPTIVSLGSSCQPEAIRAVATRWSPSQFWSMKWDQKWYAALQGQDD